MWRGGRVYRRLWYSIRHLAHINTQTHTICHTEIKKRHADVLKHVIICRIWQERISRVWTVKEKKQKKKITNSTTNSHAGFSCQHREYEKAQDTAGISRWRRARCLKCQCCHNRTSLDQVDFICQVSRCQQVLCDADSVDPDTQQSVLLLWDLCLQ